VGWREGGRERVSIREGRMGWLGLDDEGGKKGGREGGTEEERVNDLPQIQ